jgi:hypothetical protein
MEFSLDRRGSKMIELRGLKNQASQFPDPLKSIVELSRDSMQEMDFIDFFINLRKKAREIDSQNSEANR